MSNFDAILAEALDHHQAGRRDEAAALYRRVLDADPAEATALYLFGMMNFEAGRPELAEDLLDRLVKARPAHAEAHFTLANVRYWRERHAQAIAGYRTTLDLQPGHAGALINLGAALRDAGDFDGAIAAYETAIARLDDPLPAKIALGGALVAAGRPQAAADAYRAALRLEPERAETLSGLALALLNADEIEAALTTAQAALERDPTLVDAWVVQGAALSALKRPAEVVRVLEQALTLDPERASVHLNLGNAYAELRQAEPALLHLREAVALDPRMTEAHASLGSVSLLVGDFEAAERHCWLALALDPEFIGAHQNLASIYAEQGQADKARHHRDLAYRRQNVFVSRAVHARARVLTLTTSDSGNIPHKYLLPEDQYTRIDWFIEYADATQAERLPAYDLVFNAIGDADFAGATDASVARFLEVCQRPFFNHPNRVARTHRAGLSVLFAGVEGVVAPRAARLGPADLAGGLASALAKAGLSVPVLIRPVGSHGGKGLARALNEAELTAIDLGAAGEVYATSYHPFASSDGLYRKYRVIFVDRRPYPYHLAIGDDWLVHYESAPMAEHAARRDEEARFLADPKAALSAPAMRAITEIGRRLDLDYGGVDFSILPDGRVLVFEANATMLVHPEDEDGAFAYKNPYVETILSEFRAMIGVPTA